MIANLYIAHVVLEDQSACVKEEEAELRLGFSSYHKQGAAARQTCAQQSCSHGISVTLGPNL